MATKLTGPVRVRFAPSPTGFLHVGGARTAIYNELLRKSLGGAHILRIEDTDKERSDDAMTRQIIDAMAWLGIEVDEGPFLQSANLGDHTAAARRLLDEGKAYHCFRSAEELDARRTEILGRGESYRYKTAFEPPAKDEVERRLAAGEPYVVRFKMPDEAIVVEDIVRGDVTFPAESLDDFIILRSDGSPTYHLSVVCDDISMGVTHVIRGEDHLSNTPKHIGLFRALGADLPTFGHLPLILGKDKKRLSKRHGATSVEMFRDQGILPQALYNYLSLLGWSPGDDRELMDRNELIEAFTAERLGKTHGVFDEDKLKWVNAHYMASLPGGEIEKHLAPIFDTHFPAEKAVADQDPELYHTVVELHRVRSKNVVELAEGIAHYFQEGLVYDLDATKKFRKDKDVPGMLETLAERYAALEEYTVESTEKVLRDLVDELGIKLGVLIHPTRMALSGSQAGPPLFDLVVPVGQEKGARRFADFIRFLKENPIAAES